MPEAPIHEDAFGAEDGGGRPLAVLIALGLHWDAARDDTGHPVWRQPGRASSATLIAIRAALKIALTLALRYDGAVNRHWGCSDGADGFFRSLGPLCESRRQEGPAGRN